MTVVLHLCQSSVYTVYIYLESAVKKAWGKVETETERNP